MAKTRERRQRAHITPIESDCDLDDEAAPKSTNRKTKKSRRRSPRVSVKKRVKVAHAHDADRSILGVTSNLGAGGMFIHADTLLPAGSEVRLRISLEEDDESISIRGRVVRATEAPVRGMAVAFNTDEPDLDRRFIEKYIRKHTSKPMGPPPLHRPDEEQTAVTASVVALPSETTSSHVVLDEVRKTQQQHLDRLRALESQHRTADIELAHSKEDLVRAQEALERERRGVAAEREELAQEQQAVGQSIARERTHTAQQTELREREVQEQFARMHERLAELASANEALKTHCTYLENRRAAERNAGENQTDLAARGAKTRAEIAAVRAREEAARSILESTVEELRKELTGKDQEIETAQRDAKFRVWRAERQIERVRRDMEDELDQVDEARAQAIVDLDRAKEDNGSLAADIRRLELELEDSGARLQLRDAEYAELQAQMQEERKNSLMRCRQLEATIQELQAAIGELQANKSATEKKIPPHAGMSQWFGEIPVTVTPVQPDGPDKIQK